MSEEVQEQQDQVQEEVKEEAKQEEPQETQGAEASGDAPQEGSGQDKKQKINRLSKEELIKKIEALENQNQKHSKYYKHLIERKKELEALQG